MPSPTIGTIKRLFAVSGNVCAFPRCREPLVTGGNLVGDMCHIRSANPEGPRYDPAQTERERHAFENLILLCKKHHTIVDTDVFTYPVPVLMEMKHAHEKKQHDQFAISDSLAMRIAIFAAGAGATSVIGELARAVRGIAASLAELFPAKPKETEPSVLQLLDHFGPGQMAFFADNDVGKQLGTHFLYLFEGQGWQVRDIGPDRPDFIRKMEHPTLTILMSHKNQERALRAVIAALDTFLERSGFRKIKAGNWKKADGHMYVVLRLI